MCQQPAHPKFLPPPQNKRPGLQKQVPAPAAERSHLLGRDGDRAGVGWVCQGLTQVARLAARGAASQPAASGTTCL
ncbi:hypothetical protein D0439_22410 [Lysinibacillus fusiformis]|nr:hypothetical protein D0439_22410 [Lysinibacillus fusiformis]